MEFTALIANLGKYAAGIVAETPLAFPTTTEQVQKALQTIGVDGLKYEEVIVKEYSIGIAGVALHLLQAFRGLDGGTHVQPLRHDADDRARKQAQRRGQRKGPNRVRTEQKRKQREHHAERDDARAQALALFGGFTMAHLAYSFMQREGPKAPRALTECIIP